MKWEKILANLLIKYKEQIKQEKEKRGKDECKEKNSRRHYAKKALK